MKVLIITAAILTMVSIPASVVAMPAKAVDNLPKDSREDCNMLGKSKCGISWHGTQMKGGTEGTSPPHRFSEMWVYNQKDNKCNTLYHQKEKSESGISFEKAVTLNGKSDDSDVDVHSLKHTLIVEQMWFHKEKLRLEYQGPGWTSDDKWQPENKNHNIDCYDGPFYKKYNSDGIGYTDGWRDKLCWYTFDCDE